MRSRFVALVRALLSGMLVVVLLAVTGGCGEYRSGSAADKIINLTWWDYFGYSPTADRAVTTLLDKYQAAHPGIQVTRTAIAFAEFRPTLMQAAASGNFPDVAAVDNADVPMFAGRGVLADLTARMRLWQGGITFLDAVQRSVQVGDKSYGIPFRSNTTALWYNKDLFAEAGLSKPPATWEELRDHARKLTTDKHAGMCFAASPTEQGTFTLLPLIWQAGGDSRPSATRPASTR